MAWKVHHTAAVLALLGATRARGEAPAPRLAVEVSSRSRCPRADALVETLQAGFPRWRVELSRHRHDGLAVVVTPQAPGHLELQLVDRGRPVQTRDIEFERASCDDLSRTITLIVKVWVRALPDMPGHAALPKVEPVASKPEAVKPRPAPRPEGVQTPSSAVPGPEAPLVVIEPVEVTPPIPVAPEPSTPAPDPKSVLDPKTVPDPKPAPEAKAEVMSLSQAARAARVEVAAPAVATAAGLTPPPLVPPEARTAPALAPTTAAPGGPRLGLELLLGGGGFLAADGTQAGSLAPDLGGRVEFHVGERWGVSLGGGWDGALSATSAPGSVSVSRLWAGLDLLATMRPLDSTESRILLRAGPALQRLDGQGQGYTTNRQAAATDLGAELGGVWAQDLAEGFSLWAGPQVRLWARKDTFAVGNVGTVLTAPRVWLGATLGLAYRFF
jgi:hypothetical protein